MTIGLPLIAPTLPFDCYPPTPQALINAAFSLGSAQATDLTGMVISDDTPGPENFDKAWYKTSGGFPIMVFKYAGGQWLARHPSTADGNERRLWVGEAAGLVIFDGGDSGLLGASSGAMWVVDPEFVGRSPIGPGLIPDTATTLAVAENFGQGKHTLLEAELPPHIHQVPFPALKEGAGQVAEPGGPSVGNPAFPPNTGTMPTDGGLGTSTPLSIVHPVRGAFIIKRTTRVYYRG